MLAEELENVNDDAAVRQTSAEAGRSNRFPDATRRYLKEIGRASMPPAGFGRSSRGDHDSDPDDSSARPRRCGVRNFEPQTLAEVDRAVGLTRERVKQIQLDALARLKRQMQAQGLDALAVFDCRSTLQQRQFTGLSVPFVDVGWRILFLSNVWPGFGQLLIQFEKLLLIVG